MTARIIIIVVCIALASAPCLGDAATIDLEILRVKNDRVYFDAGTDEYIFDGHRFALLCQEDTVAVGSIERSFDGLSFGRMTVAPDSLEFDSCIAQVEVASIDSTGTIVVGLVESSPLNHWQVVSCSRQDSVVGAVRWLDSSRAVVTREFKSQLAMVLAYESGEIDAMISPERPAPRGREAVIIPQPAPYFFALLPNLSSHGNTDAVLTTSLYYRFDQSRLAHLYTIAPALPIDRLCLDSSTRVRPYDFNPALGRTILARMTPPLRRVAISYEYESLQSLAEFFGDVLSRDRVRISLGQNPASSDVRITAIPLYGDRPWMSMEVIGHILAQDTAANSRESERVRQLFERLQLARQFRNDKQGASYLSRAEQGLTDDLGVFALFRPTVYIAILPRIVGVEFTDEGRVDFCGAIRLLPPGKEADLGDAP